MSKTGRYVQVLGEDGKYKLVKVSDKGKLPMPVVWGRHNSPDYYGRRFENLDHEPVYCGTKRALRYEMEKRGVAQKDA